MGLGSSFLRVGARRVVGVGEGVRVVVTHIISRNVRGLGGFEKRKEVSNMVREKNPFILCLQ